MITITITKYVGNEQIKNETTYDLPVTFEQMDELHREYSEANPDSWVNMITTGSPENSFIMGMREGQRVDELLLDIDLMDWETYKSKWFPSTN
jgi:hypothetical protein